MKLSNNNGSIRSAGPYVALQLRAHYPLEQRAVPTNAPRFRGQAYTYRSDCLCWLMAVLIHEPSKRCAKRCTIGARHRCRVMANTLWPKRILSRALSLLTFETRDPSSPFSAFLGLERGRTALCLNLPRTFVNLALYSCTSCPFAPFPLCSLCDCAIEGHVPPSLFSLAASTLCSFFKFLLPSLWPFLVPLARIGEWPKRVKGPRNRRQQSRTLGAHCRRVSCVLLLFFYVLLLI